MVSSSKFAGLILPFALLVSNYAMASEPAEPPPANSTPHTPSPQPAIGITVNLGTDICYLRFSFKMVANDPAEQPELNRIIFENPILSRSFLEASIRSVESLNRFPTAEECSIEGDFSKDLQGAFKVELDNFTQGLRLLMPELRGKAGFWAEVSMQTEPFTNERIPVVPPNQRLIRTPNSSERIATRAPLLNQSPNHG